MKPPRLSPLPGSSTARPPNQRIESAMAELRNSLSGAIPAWTRIIRHSAREYRSVRSANLRDSAACVR